MATNCDKLFKAIIYGKATSVLNSPSPYTPFNSQILKRKNNDYEQLCNCNTF